jgi:hypothetical protein
MIPLIAGYDTADATNHEVIDDIELTDKTLVSAIRQRCYEWSWWGIVIDGELVFTEGLDQRVRWDIDLTNEETDGR